MFFNLEQLLKRLVDIAFKFDGSVTLVRFVQSLKTPPAKKPPPPLPMPLPPPIVSTLSGIVILKIFVQPLKAE